MVIRHLDTVIVLGLVAAVGILLWLLFGKTETTDYSVRPTIGPTKKVEVQISMDEAYSIARFDQPPIRDEIKTTCSSVSDSGTFFIRPDFTESDPAHFVVIGAKGFLSPENLLYARFEFSVDTPETIWVFLPLVRIVSLDSNGGAVTDRIFAPWEYHNEHWQPTCSMGSGSIVEGRVFLGNLDETEQVESLAIEFCSYIVSPGQDQCRSGLASQ